jgi:hypothetical protein
VRRALGWHQLGRLGLRRLHRFALCQRHHRAQ